MNASQHFLMLRQLKIEIPYKRDMNGKDYYSKLKEQCNCP